MVKKEIIPIKPQPNAEILVFPVVYTVLLWGECEAGEGE